MAAGESLSQLSRGSWPTQDGAALVSHGQGVAMATQAPDKSSDGRAESSSRPGVQGPPAHSHSRLPHAASHLPPSCRRGQLICS